jgi:hypothetical protein
MIFRHVRHWREVNQRAAEARAAVEEARRRLEHDRKTIVVPMRGRGARNHFADLIKESIQEHQ